MPRSTPPMPAGGLYAVTPDGLPLATLLDRVAAALDGGAALVQYRDKGRAAADQRACAHALVALCHPRGVPLIVNDSLELALEVAAAGLHLGGDDGDLAAARAQLGPGQILGVSCYDSEARAETASALGADYLAFGSFYASSTKPSRYRPQPELLQRVAELGLPRVAIGGIKPDNGARLVAAGADFVAACGGVFDAADVALAARRYADLFPPRQEMS